jgi:hypothetical protein
MTRSRVFALVATAVVAVAAVAAPADAATGPKPMALTVADLGSGAVVDSQQFTTSGPIPASRGYVRSFTGVTLGPARLFTLQDTVLVGKTSSAAAKLVSAILLTASSKAGRDTLLAESQKSFAASSHMAVSKGAVTRAGELDAGDSAVEIVFRFDTQTGSFQVGEIFVRVGETLSTIYYGAGTPGVSQSGARRLALLAAKHMREASAG